MFSSARAVAWALPLVAIALVTTQGCTKNVVHPPAPAGPNVNSALNEGKCGDVTAGGEPLVVDWRPDRRGALESALGDKIVIVHYDCKRFEVLEDCSADGSYGFVGFGAKEQVVKLLTADEVRANLPLSGAGLAVDLAADMARGASLDVAMVMIGRKSTTRKDLRKTDLHGSCADATHFVRRAVLGAFAISQGSRAEAGTTASVFGASASARGKISRLEATKDGDLAGCSSASPTSKSAPEKCGALLRVSLTPLVDKLEVASGSDDQQRVSCAAGFVLSEGKCVASAAQLPHVCKPDNPQDCVAQCEKKSGESCTILGRYYRDVLQPKDPARARWALQQACSLDDFDGCASLGAMLLYGEGGPKEEARAHELFKRACDRGAARGCYNEATTLDPAIKMAGFGFVEAVPEKVGLDVLNLFVRACDGGYWAGCSAAGSMYMDARGIPVDPPNAAKYRSRACDANFANACSNYGWQLLNGKGVPKDPPRALKAYYRGCELGDDVGCSGLGLMLGAKMGTAEEQAAGKELLRKRCTENQHKWACNALQNLGP
jgi:uncharacterized protein